MASIEEVASVLANCRNDCRCCERVLESYLLQTRNDCIAGRKNESLLSYFLNTASDAQFRKLFHVSKNTVSLLINEIQKITKCHLFSPKDNSGDNGIIYTAITVLFLTSCFSIKFISLFSGLPRNIVKSVVSQFVRVFNDIKDYVIYFPSLQSQHPLKADSKRNFPGSVGVIGSPFCLSLKCRYRIHSRVFCS